MLAEQRKILDRIRMEYVEMPDLCLTFFQARRLWNLEPDLCDSLLTALIGEGFLMRTSEGTFRRRTSDRVAMRVSV